VDAIVHWGDASDGARFLNQMRARGMKQPFFACDRCLSDEFLEIAGKNAEGVMCLYPWNPNRKDDKLEEFRKAFRQKYNSEAETYASHAYDGTNMLIWAIQVAGLNRAKIRDVIAYRNEAWPGVTGDIVFSSVLDDMGEVYLARRENGAWKYYSRKDLGLEQGSTSVPEKTSVQAPAKNAFEHPTTYYAGSGRELEPPADLKEVRLGYFGPHDPKDAEGGEAWQAAQLAIAEANAAGGYQGKPFRLVPALSADPWKAGVTQLARAVYQDKVWAIIGGIDGPSTHLAEQVAVKARLPLISPSSTDKTVNRASVPWMFSCAASDDQQVPILAEDMAARIGDKPFVLVSTTQHDPRLFTVELKKALDQLRLQPRLAIECQGGARESSGIARRVMAANPAAVVVAADAHDGASLVKSLRQAGFQGLIYGSSSMGRQRFVREAGAAAEGVRFPLLYVPTREATAFTRAFRNRQNTSPDYAAAQTYDAVRLVLAAIRKGGLNRARIQDSLRGLSPWQGIAGTVAWDNLGGNIRTVPLGIIQGGQQVKVEEQVTKGR
jgi:ABC-type branched-subunit amino acid transport system substrate-binding protein